MTPHDCVKEEVRQCYRGIVLSLMNVFDRCFSREIYSVLFKRQMDRALKRSGLPNIRQSGDILYVQWLCLFRFYRHFAGIKR